MTSRKKILLTVVTYPLPSRSYEELVCTAGITEEGEWIRIYPVPLSFLQGKLKSDKKQSYKYTWIELDLNKRKDDLRPESFSPKNYDFRDIEILERVNTDCNWKLRKRFCLENVYESIDQLIEDSKAPQNKSLATFKPQAIKKLEIKKCNSKWKDEWKELRRQGDLFLKNQEPMRKLPYKFSYIFEDTQGKSSRLMIEDWEIGQLYWHCLKRAKEDTQRALEGVRQKYEEEFINNKDIYFFLGTTKKWHTKRSRNPFVIVGIFYPKKKKQPPLFSQQ